MKSLDSVIQSFEIVLKNPKIMLITLISYILVFLILFSAGFLIGISNIISTLDTDSFPSELYSNFPLVVGVIILCSIILFLIAPFPIGMLISSGIQVLKGKLSLSKAFDEAKRKYFSILGVSLISTAAFIAIVVSLLLPLILSWDFKPLFDFFVVFDIVLFLIASFLLSVFFFQANTLVFTENKKAFEAVKRSFYIGKQKFLSILATLFFLLIIVFGIGFVEAIIKGILSILFIIDLSLLAIFAILFFIFVEIPINCFLFSASSILPVVFYYNYNLKKL
jgi:hypothetical protein